MTIERYIRNYGELISPEDQQILLDKTCAVLGAGGNGGYVIEYSLTNEAKKFRTDEIMEWHNSIKELDPTYVIPSRPNSTSGGCYVATAIYGSYDCPEVWTLRRFRDFTLAERWYGRAFIKIYYAISPILVKWFGKTIWFKNIFQKPLNKLVKELQDKGVEDTPYSDRIW